MSYRVPKIVKITFENYLEDSKVALDELSKLHLMVSKGSTTKRQVTISIDKPESIEVRIYDLSKLNKKSYFDFNRRIKKLIK